MSIIIIIIFVITAIIFIVITTTIVITIFLASLTIANICQSPLTLPHLLSLKDSTSIITATCIIDTFSLTVSNIQLSTFYCKHCHTHCHQLWPTSSFLLLQTLPSFLAYLITSAIARTVTILGLPHHFCYCKHCHHS